MSGTRIHDVLPALTLAAMLGVPRMLAFMIVVPVFPSSVFPQLLRTGMAIGLGAPVAAGVYHELGAYEGLAILVAIVIKEIVLGALLGVAVAAPMWAIEAAGALADNQRGANAAQQVTPFAQADASLLGAALQQSFIVFLATSGAFALMYQLLLHSYAAWPVMQLMPDLRQFGFELATMRFDEFMARTVLFAAPMIAVVLLIDFTFAVMSVFAPQLQTYFASMPVKSLAVLGILAVYLLALLQHGEAYFLDALRRESLLLDASTSKAR